jgi:hypothetical protein
MAGSQKLDKTKKKKAKADGVEQSRGQGSARRRELKELDDFIEKTLEEAGEEFLDEFKQIEGE